VSVAQRLLAATGGALLLSVTALAPGAGASAPAAPTSARAATHGTPIVASPLAPNVRPGPRTPTQNAARAHALARDAKAYAAQKAAANAAAHVTTPAPSAAPSAASNASVLQSWQGIHDVNYAPSDSTSAVGSSRFVELVNSDFAIYDRSSTTPIATGTLNALSGAPTSSSVFDPQIMWDPASQRFFYVMVEAVSATQNNLRIGYSLTATPSSAADWCRLTFSYGSSFPDYPKLGDSADLVVIGANIFLANNKTRGDLLAFFKPPSGNTCTALSGSTDTGLVNADGTQAWTPVPANDVEGAPTNYTVAIPFGGGTYASLFGVTDNGSSITFSGARTLTLPSYSVPANVPQPSPAKYPLDSLDGRVTQAVEAVDPSQSNQLAMWTQHTVFGGAGAEVRWYEINPTPATPVLFQSGSQTSSTLFTFNAAISPDRRVLGTDRRFGNAMVLGFNTGSSAQAVDDRVVSKVGSGATSAAVVVNSSAGPLADDGCNSSEHPGVCRWGDYAGASPDPSSDTTQSQGVVWLTNAYSVPHTGSFSDYRTWNWTVRPAPK
jgi:hypothetical protein